MRTIVSVPSFVTEEIIQLAAQRLAHTRDVIGRGGEPIDAATLAATASAIALVRQIGAGTLPNTAPLGEAELSAMSRGQRTIIDAVLKSPGCQPVFKYLPSMMGLLNQPKKEVSVELPETH